MNPQAKEYAISSNQSRAIHTLKAKLGISEDNYRAILSAYKKESSKDLTSTEAGEIISNFSNRLNGKKNNLPPRYYGKGERNGKAKNSNLSQLQAKRIDILEKILGWDSVRTLDFIKKQTGNNSAVQMLTMDNAGKVIVGMEKILSWNKRVEYGEINKLSNDQIQRKYSKC